MEEKICRHKNLVELTHRHKQCSDCGVWKGTREDAHHYSMEYYTNKVFGLFDACIPKRTINSEYYKFTHFKNLEIDTTQMRKILEIGGGVCQTSYSLALEGKDVIVVESSQWATKWMKESYGERNGFKIIDANFENVDKSLIGKDFDFIFANHVFEHLVDPMTAIEYCYDILVDNGKFFLIVPNQEREKNMHHTHEWAFSIDVLKKWFEQVGFKDIKIQEFPGSVEEVKQLGGAHIRIVGTK